MKKYVPIATITALFFFCAGAASRGAVPGIIPKPVSVEEREGVFVFGYGTGIRYGCSHTERLADYLSERTGHRAVSLSDTETLARERNTVRLSIDPTCGLPAEGYRLEVAPDSITIRAPDRAGMFYGIQTLVQLSPPDVCILGRHFETFDVPCVAVTDFPRFGYRGFMLDVARTFTGIEDVGRILEQMAFHKLNRFHWHMTDDEGWRLPLEGHPRLAAEGGFRGGGSPVHNIYGSWGRRYGGHYTHEEVQKLISYAKFLNIEVIPEFDIPGHSRAVARIYPEILCRGPVDTAASAGYDLRKVWCAGREENFELLRGIIDEICAIFPSAVIHTGGDEVPPEQWESCPDCRALMEREGLKDTKQLNTWFANRVGEMVAENGRRQAVWNEAMDGGTVHGDPLIWAWENEASVDRAVRHGYKTVAMPAQRYYFDMKQSQREIGLAWAAIIGLRDVYDYDPVGSAAGPGEVVGVEAGLWTESFLWNGEWWREYQIFPRLCALAETAWSPTGGRSFADFQARLDGWHLDRLEAMGIEYRGSDGIRTAYTVPADRLKPAYDVTGSVPCTAKNPYPLAADNDTKTFARTVRTPRAGDWFEYRFRKPVTCSSITVRSGYSGLPRFVVGPAVLEVSYDGTTYETVDPNFGYTGTFRPSTAVHAVRLTVTGEGNGEDAAILQDLVVMP